MSFELLFVKNGASGVFERQVLSFALNIDARLLSFQAISYIGSFWFAVYEFHSLALIIEDFIFVVNLFFHQRLWNSVHVALVALRIFFSFFFPFSS